MRAAFASTCRCASSGAPCGCPVASSLVGLTLAFPPTLYVVRFRIEEPDAANSTAGSGSTMDGASVLTRSQLT